MGARGSSGHYEPISANIFILDACFDGISTPGGSVGQMSLCCNHIRECFGIIRDFLGIDNARDVDPARANENRNTDIAIFAHWIYHPTHKDWGFYRVFIFVPSAEAP